MATLTGTLPDLRAAYAKLDAYAKSQGIGIAVADFGGVRTLADTTRILKFREDDYRVAVQNGSIAPDTTLNRFRPIAPFGSSYHNYGAAFDVMITSRPATLSYGAALAKLGSYAPSIGLRWGGAFTNPDPPHFELAITLEQARQKYAASGGAASNLDASTSSFDFSKFLPSLTPAVPDGYATDTGDGLADAGDMGDLTYDDLPPEDDGSAGILITGVIVAGLVLWALRRHFT
jgi:hypothetical protein